MKCITISFCLFLMIGVISMLNSNGFAEDFKYAQFSSKDSELNISMEYISGWDYREHKGPEESYVSVLFFENRKDQEYKAKIVLAAKDASKPEAKPETIEAVAQDLLAKRSLFKDSKVLSNLKTELLGLEARDILLSYKAMDKIYSVDAKSIQVKERVVIFKKDNKIYSLRYENTEQGFDSLNSAFSHIITTLKFINN